ncbi:PRC-barrel domain-containing protein [Azospirillum halopraeferens]|uniref:PRC-barrel domain-containing protein n=1 Tax=Azospirillum halopraeferens TaxID=34010 RepID=UPI00048D39CC|nr:PRC-barrel domain-containing protein [Azospirillum halopraeferens]
MRSMLLVAVLTAGVLAAVQPARAQQPSCDEPLSRLDQEVDALEGGAVPLPALTRDELAELDSLRQAARTLAQAGNADACARVVRHALGVAETIRTPRLLSADGLRSLQLRGADGEEVGAIQEVVVDPRNGRIAYAVVELGGFLGIGERYFPVPWAVFETGVRGEGLVLKVPRERLVTAPQYTRDHRPDMSDRQWALALHTYYGVEPYWLQGGAILAGQVEQAGRNAEAVSRLEQEVMRLSQSVERLTHRLEEPEQPVQTAPDTPEPDTPAAESEGPPAPAQ